MVSIAAFQAVDPGSIPGRRNEFVFQSFFYPKWNIQKQNKQEYGKP